MFTGGAGHMSLYYNTDSRTIGSVSGAMHSSRLLQQTGVRRRAMEVAWRSDTPVCTGSDGSVRLPMYRILGEPPEAICLVTHGRRATSAMVGAQ
jgi:hypothetical protein